MKTHLFLIAFLAIISLVGCERDNLDLGGPAPGTCMTTSAGTITGTTTINNGSAVTLSTEGNAVASSIIWQSSTDGTHFYDIEGTSFTVRRATINTLTDKPATTTWYRLKTTDCSILYSNEIKITVNK